MRNLLFYFDQLKICLNTEFYRRYLLKLNYTVRTYKDLVIFDRSVYISLLKRRLFWEFMLVTAKASFIITNSATSSRINIPKMLMSF